MTKSTNLFEVAGKRTLVTGGTAGIGRGVAEHFVESGADVVICGRRASGPEIASQIGAQFVHMDVGDRRSVAEGVTAAAGLLGGAIDVLVLNAGVGPPAVPVQDISPDDMLHAFGINVFGVLYCMQSSLRFIGEGGSVIITSSAAGCMTMAGNSAYGSSKAAVNALTRTWAIELAPQGIRVNAVLPCIIETEMAFDPENIEAELEMLRTLTVNGKIRQPRDIAPIYRFLASPAADVITGAVIACDDGISAGFSSLLLDKAFG